VSQNLELLRRLCRSRVHASVLSIWFEAIDEIHFLYEERNRIFHGMFFEDQEKLLLVRVRKGKNGKSDQYGQVEIDDYFVPDLLARLSSRRRQFHDFLGDYATNDAGPAHTPSQDIHPSLCVNGNSA
jgi:hypothetical protein